MRKDDDVGVYLDLVAARGPCTLDELAPDRLSVESVYRSLLRLERAGRAVRIEHSGRSMGRPAWAARTANGGWLVAEELGGSRPG